MIGFNYLLGAVGLELGRTRLVRHQDGRAALGKAPYDLWVSNDGRFEIYQQVQLKDHFKAADQIASFVATPLNETLFVGLYRVEGSREAPAGTTCPSTGDDLTGAIWYDLKPDATLADYGGRLVVDWGAGFRTWVQRPDRNDKPIVEIRRQGIEVPFPGFDRFSWPIRELSAVPTNWRVALGAVSGVYLLACRLTGKQYVGSAYGAGGFWARWEEYFRTGHGNNEGMKLSEDSEYLVSILEFAPANTAADEIIRREAGWKDKLLTRTFGLNRN